VDGLIMQLQLQTHEVNQQGELNPRKDLLHTNAKVHVAVEQVPGKPEGVEFNMQIGDVVSEDHLYERIKMLMVGLGLTDDIATSSDDVKLRLLGYAEKQSGDYIHANMYTSIRELIQDANEIRVAVV